MRVKLTWISLTVFVAGLLTGFVLISKRPRVMFFFTEMDYSDNYTHQMQVPTPCLVTKVEIILSPVEEIHGARTAVWVSCL